jgi:tripartite-type tricarboxylate transporter receptor subunit TctC
MTFSHIVRCVVLIFAVSCVPASSWAQDNEFPNRPLRLLVGYSAGGGLDTMARILAQAFSAQLRQPVVVENRTGAAGMMAADNIAKSPADGYSLLMGETGLLIASHLQRKALVNPLTDLTPVAGLFNSQLMVVANPQFPASDPKGLIDTIKANPGKYTYATSGIGSVHHLGFELLKSRAGLNILHIPYRGASQLIPDLLNNQVSLAVVSAAAGHELTTSKRLKAVALLTDVDPSRAGNVRTMAEVLPGYNVMPQQVLYAPAGTPRQIVDRLTQAVKVVLSQNDVIKRAVQQGVEPAYRSPDTLAQDLRRESEQWNEIIKKQNIKAE